MEAVMHDDTGAVDEYLLDHQWVADRFSPVVVGDALRDAVARGWAEEFEPGWFRITRIGKLRLRALRARSA